MKALAITSFLIAGAFFLSAVWDVVERRRKLRTMREEEEKARPRPQGRSAS